MKKIIGSTKCHTISTMLNINNDNFTDDDIDKAEILNDNEIEAPPFWSCTSDRLMNIQINENEVLYILQIIKLGDASGLNSIIHHLLRYTANSVNNYLAVFFIFNMSLRYGKFPNNWKIYVSIPLFKCGKIQL